MPKTISKDTPLAEITLRKYEKPQELEEREIVRKLCLSLGLLQPGDSRDIIIDVFYVLLIARKNAVKLSAHDVEKNVIALRTKLHLPLHGIAASNIRRQLKRLKQQFLIESHASLYRITEDAQLSDVFEEKIEKYILPSILSRVREYVKEIDHRFAPPKSKDHNV